MKIEPDIDKMTYEDEKATLILNIKSLHLKSPKCKVFDQHDVKETLHKLHANYVLVLADKVANNVIIVYKKY